MFKTNLLTLAAYLYSRENLEFAGLNKSDPSRIMFLFKPAGRAEKAAEEFFMNKDGAMELFKNYHTLREMVFSVKRNLDDNN